MTERRATRARIGALLLSIALAAPENYARAEVTPPASLPDVTVIAPRPPTEAQLAGAAVPRFVESHATASVVIHQLTRWRKEVCPQAVGLDPASNAFIAARMRAVAMAVGAPWNSSASCKPNVEIIFAADPEAILATVLKKDSQLLGFHYPQQARRLATMTRPIQGWYVTSTRNYKGEVAVDEPVPLGTGQSLVGTPTGSLPDSKVPPGLPGSRLTNLRSSEVGFALIVVDGYKILQFSMTALSDYLAMLTLSQAKSPDACGQLPSIMDLLAADCDGGEKPAQITAGDLAFLKALYRANLETPIELEQSNIEAAMMRDFRKE